jgi:hypothetical protein
MCEPYGKTTIYHMVILISSIHLISTWNIPRTSLIFLYIVFQIMIVDLQLYQLFLLPRYFTLVPPFPTPIHVTFSLMQYIFPFRVYKGKRSMNTKFLLHNYMGEAWPNLTNFYFLVSQTIVESKKGNKIRPITFSQVSLMKHVYFKSLVL